MQTPYSGILDWQDGQPVSTAFGDVYFSRSSGLEETRHVFLNHNHLPQRWQDKGLRRFTIAETGFGTGLNFLSAWQLWDRVAPPSARLHFVSTEQYPLTLEDLRRALELWPELVSYSQQLLAQYELLAPGWRRFEFDHGRITLTLLIGDARSTLPELHAVVDAWFLDGFAPARNPEMWGSDILEQVARLTGPEGTFATFTAAGVVRRGLENVGFQVEKVAGFGSKRDMLRGAIHRPRELHELRPRTAVVVGGGIAGCATAHSLAKRGWQVTLVERHAHLASEASGNAQGVLYPRLSGHDIPLSRIAQTGFLHTRWLARGVLNKGRDWDDCGLLQQAFNARETKRIEEVVARGLPEDLVHAVDATEASLLAGIDMPNGGLWFPRGGWMHPPALCRALATHPGVMIRTSSDVLHLQAGGQGWRLMTASGCLAEGSVVILAGANETSRFPQAAHIPLEPVRGQVSHLPETAASSKLKAVICTEGYISPAREGMHCTGASFHPEDRSLEIRYEDHRHNLSMLKALSPALFEAFDTLDPESLAGRTALRCATPDYLPAAGPLLDAVELLQRYSPGSRIGKDHLPWLDGLHVNVGHGSKGLMTAPLCAELIAARLEGEPLPMDATLAAALDPNRFLLRERGLKRLIGAAIGYNPLP